MKKKIGLVVGADADLPGKMVGELGVHVYGYPIQFREFRDTEDFYRQMRVVAKERMGDAPRTSQPSVKVFQDLFAALLREYEELVVFTISASLSGSYNAAAQGKKLLSVGEQERVHIFDSRGTTGGEALLVMRAVELVASGMGVAELITQLRWEMQRIHLLGVVDTPLWLQRGGRISAVQAMVVSNLQKAGLRPILTLREGKIVTKKIQMGAWEKTKALFEQFRQEMLGEDGSGKKISVVITHGDCPTAADRLGTLIAACPEDITVRFIGLLSPVLGSHLGPDSLVVAWRRG